MNITLTSMLLPILLLTTTPMPLLMALPTPLYAGSLDSTIDMVVAFVDDSAITMRELNEAHSAGLETSPALTRKETLERMINTKLLLNDARKLRLTASDDKELMGKYLEVKVRALIHISEKDILGFFRTNRAKFGNRPYGEVKEEIRIYLEELKYNKVLKERLDSLRKESRIVILSIP